MMGACVLCSEFTRATCKCAYYTRKLGKPMYMKLSEIYRQVRCDGYKRKRLVEKVCGLYKEVVA